MREGETRRVKSCTRCGEEKSVESFHRSSSSKDGFQYECKSCSKKRQREPKNAEKRRRYAWLGCLKEKGITEKQYDEAFEAQSGLCAICHKPENGKKLAIDHDHACCPDRKACGECFRGLLCMKCNQGIGLLGDDPSIITNALLYLKGKR
jgi:hypothetical protein